MRKFRSFIRQSEVRNIDEERGRDKYEQPLPEYLPVRADLRANLYRLPRIFVARVRLFVIFPSGKPSPRCTAAERVRYSF